MLLLGGDAHYGRDVLLRKMHAAGALERALWSLSTPSPCHRGSGPDPGWQAFCSQFPKTLDRPLRGEHERSTKDVDVPPPWLYRRTRFSAVFESVIGTGDDCASSSFEPCPLPRSIACNGTKMQA